MGGAAGAAVRWGSVRLAATEELDSPNSAVGTLGPPVLSAILVGLGALVFANVVAALPGRIAARTPTALVLRTE